ncbi:MULTISPECIES: hypothetical protein [unclassified Microbacterium]|uniref:hypothetical protein n=1 Tax=unclassified Microbacterium TaxID=2609290 RepID=UPI00160542D1|nr:MULTISPECIES: hypothetical protein [unclassified Microbacterium]QNA93271.1 hypothetical protein G4G29_14800 [Microbacterium sp. Se63.02b]QYM63480.1 hypothetical protein K1X59_14850 [Microbacterium sp. Se5.02b]
MPDLTAIGGWVVAVIVGAIAAVASLFPKKGSLEHQMIDQQQERIETLEKRVDSLEPALLRYQRKDLAWERREAQLMSGVERGEYPPWPEKTGILAEEKHD